MKVGQAVKPEFYNLTAPVAISADGTTVMYMQEERVPVIVDSATGFEIASLEGLPGSVESLALSPDGSSAVVSGASDGSGFTWLWNLETVEPIDKVRVLTLDPRFSPDGTRIAIPLFIREQGDIGIRNAMTPKIPFPPVCCLPGGVWTIAFSADGKRLAGLGRRGGLVKVWDALDGEEVLSGPAGELSPIALAPGGTLIARALSGGSIQIFDLDDQRETLVLSGHRGAVVDIQFIDGGTRLISASNAGDTRVWDLEFEAPGTLTWNAHPGRGAVGNRVTFSPDSQTLLTTTGEGASALWNADTGFVIMRPTILSGIADFLGGAFSPDGSIFALGGVGTFVETRTFDAVTGERLHNFPKDFAYANSDVAFSPDGSRLATVANGGFFPYDGPKIWDVATGRMVRSLSKVHAEIGERSVAWSPRGDLIATGSPDGGTRIWNAQTFEMLESLDADVLDLAFSPDGSMLATAGRELLVWDVTTWQQSAPFSGLSAWMSAISFSPDGSQLLGGGDDATPRLWDVATGDLVLALPAHETSVSGVAVSPDGSTLATISEDGELRVRPATLAELVELARDRVSRSLTEAECRQYLHTTECPT